MKKLIETFAQGTQYQYSWGSNKEPTKKEIAMIVGGAFLGVVVAKFFGM